MEEGVLDPTSVIFGFGRRYVCCYVVALYSADQGISRICPGRDLAQTLLVLLMACTLQNFDIAPARDEAGNPIPLVAEGVPGVIKLVDVLLLLVDSLTFVHIIASLSDLNVQSRPDLRLTRSLFVDTLKFLSLCRTN